MINKEKYLQFEKTDEQNTNLYIYGDIRKQDLIDRWFGDDETRVDAFSFKEALEKVDTPNLTVRINSYGGSVSEGLAIYSLLSDFKGNLRTIVDGFACSAASVIFMAGKERIVPENGLLMIHNAWSSVEGDSNAIKKAAEDLEKITQPSVNIYVAKTGLPEKEIKAMMDEEKWITSQEAFDMGFSTAQVKKDDAQQALEANYMFNLVLKLKEKDKEIEKLRSEMEQKTPNENRKQNNLKPIKEDAWASFFNTKK